MNHQRSDWGRNFPVSATAESTFQLDLRRYQPGNDHLSRSEIFFIATYSLTGKIIIITEVLSG